MRTLKTIAFLFSVSGGLNAVWYIVLLNLQMSWEDWGHRGTCSQLGSSSYSNSPVCTIFTPSERKWRAPWSKQRSIGITPLHSVNGNEGTKGLNVSSPSNPIWSLEMTTWKCMETSNPAEFRRKSEGSGISGAHRRVTTVFLFPFIFKCMYLKICWSQFYEISVWEITLSHLGTGEQDTLHYLKRAKGGGCFTINFLSYSQFNWGS